MEAVYQSVSLHYQDTKSQKNRSNSVSLFIFTFDYEKITIRNPDV